MALFNSPSNNYLGNKKLYIVLFYVTIITTKPTTITKNENKNSTESNK